MSIHRVVSVVVLTALVVMAAVSVPLASAQDGPTSDLNDPLIAYLLDLVDTVFAPSEPVSEEAAEPFRSSRVIWHDAGTPAVTVEESVIPFLDWNNMERSTMTDRQRTIERIVRYGDLVWAQVTIDATLQQPWPDSWARNTLERFQLPMVTRTEQLVIFRFEDGQIAETWEYLDHPLVWYIFHNLICSGWEIPLAASDMYPADVATVEDHVLLMEGEKIAVVQKVIDMMNTAARPSFAGMMSHHVILHNPRGPEVWTLPAWNIPWFATLHEVMPDYQMEIQHIVEHEDMVWVHWRSTGTLTNPATDVGMLNINAVRPYAAQTRKVEAEGVYLFRFEGDKIAEWWWYEDNNLLTVATTNLCFIAFQ